MTQHLALFLVLACAVAYVFSTVPVSANIDGVDDYSRTLAFVNLMKQSRKFGSPQKPWDGTAELGPSGWPTGDFGVVVFSSDVEMGGTYKFQCKGNASVKAVASDAKVTDLVFDESTGLLSANILVGDTADQLMLSFENTNGKVMDVYVLQAGYTMDRKDDFSDLFIGQLKRFSLLRFMDWGNTNGSPVKDWSDRTPPDWPSYAWGPKGSTGVPWEVCIKLCNQLKADPWFNVPHMASDDYVNQFATLIKNNLDPGLAVHVEYSNEVWNWQFPQSHWSLAQATAEVKAGDKYHLNYDGANNTGYWMWRRTGLRIKQISDQFATIFGAETFNSRFKPVLAGQVAYPEPMKQGLEYIDAVWGPPAKFISSIAGAPYFGLGAANKRNLTKAEVLSTMEDTINSYSTTNGVGENNPLGVHRAFAAWYNVALRGYEGGPDTFGPNSIQAKKDATLDPQMTKLVVQYLTTWYAYGAEALNWFVAGASNYETKFGTWGLTNNMHDEDSPKIQGIDAIRNGALPETTFGTLLPDTINATHFVSHPHPIRDPYLRYLSVNSTWDYVVRMPNDGSVSLTLYTASSMDTAQLGVSVNSGEYQVVTTPNTGDKKFAPCHPLNLKLHEGINVVRLKVLTNRGYSVQSLVFAM